MPILGCQIVPAPSWRQKQKGNWEERKKKVVAVCMCGGEGGGGGGGGKKEENVVFFLPLTPLPFFPLSSFA